MVKEVSSTRVRKRHLAADQNSPPTACQANSERQPVSPGEYPPAHFLTADSAHPGSNMETVMTLC